MTTRGSTKDVLLQHKSPGQLTAWPEGNTFWPNQLSGLVCDPRVQGSNPSQVHLLHMDKC